MIQPTKLTTVSLVQFPGNRHIVCKRVHILERCANWLLSASIRKRL